MLSELFKKISSKRLVVNNFGGSSSVVVTAISVFALSQLLASFIVGFGIALLNQGKDLAAILNNSILAQFFFLLLAEGLAIGLVLLILKRLKLNLETIGLRRPKSDDVYRGITGFGLFYVLLIIISIVLTIIFPSINNTPQNIGFNNVVGSGSAILAFISLVILPPIGEEVLIRGYLFSGLRSKMSFVKAGLITSLLFSIAHLELGQGTALVWGAAADTFLLSLVLVYLRETTGALYAGMIVHALNNLVAFFLKYH